MRKRLVIIGAILVLGTASLLTGCGGEKSVGDKEIELAKNLKDKANDAVDKANQTNPDSLLDNMPGD